MKRSPQERSNPLDLKPDPNAAAAACRTLIRAYLGDPEGIEWPHVQDALGQALSAFGLPESYIESEGGRWQ